MENEGQFPDLMSIAALLQAGRSTVALPIQKSDLPHAKPFLVLRDKEGNERVEFVGEVIDAPDHISGAFAVADEASFLEYFNRYSTESSLIFGSLAPAHFVAILNEHEPGGTPDWRDHTLTLTLTHSEEWNTWIGHNGKNKAFAGQVEFAEWLEDQLPDIVDPPNGQLLELVLAFKVVENITFSQATRLQDGQTQLNYNQVVDGTVRGQAGEIRIPGEFTILIPVFKGMNAPKYPMQARFRYRLSGGKLTLWYELVRPHKVVEQAFTAVWNKIAEEAGRPILLGKT